MDKSKNNKRREFLALGFIAGAGVLSKAAGVNKLIAEADTEKIKMLTTDGKLVEVDAQVLKNNPSNQKASIEEIHHWISKDKNSEDT